VDQGAYQLPVADVTDEVATRQRPEVEPPYVVAVVFQGRHQGLAERSPGARHEHSHNRLPSASQSISQHPHQTLAAA